MRDLEDFIYRYLKDSEEKKKKKEEEISTKNQHLVQDRSLGTRRSAAWMSAGVASHGRTDCFDMTPSHHIAHTNTLGEKGGMFKKKVFDLVF